MYARCVAGPAFDNPDEARYGVKKVGNSMSVDSDIEQIKKQERELQFTRFNEDDAWALGSLMRETAVEQKLPLVIDIRMGARPLFYTALANTAEDNADWARRKINSVMKTHASSYRLALEERASGRSFVELRGISTKDYAVAGGSFPINIKNVGVVGTVTVSGIPQRKDHGFVVECLCKFHKVDHASLALPPEGE
jgi:uncharacterized protein (UPF0303 family)